MRWRVKGYIKIFKVIGKCYHTLVYINMKKQYKENLELHKVMVIWTISINWILNIGKHGTVFAIQSQIKLPDECFQVWKQIQWSKHSWKPGRSML